MSFVPPTQMPPARPKYWRSLESFENSGGEFTAGASAWADSFSRRNFVKLMSASLLLAGLTGCRRPEERIYPFAKGQEDVPGVPQYYATSMPTRRGAVPLVVKSHEGRPIKIEGNPRHPGSRGGTDVFAQASILSLYDPDRARRFAENGQTRTPSEVLAFLASLRSKLGTGHGLAFLLEQSTSPSRTRLQRTLSEQYPEARWFVYEPVDFDTPRHTTSLVYGQSLEPHYRLDKAEVILSLDCDFLGSEEGSIDYTRQFAETRRLANGSEMSRLYSVESLFTLTGANADHRLRVAPSQMVSIAARFAQLILKDRANTFEPALAKLAAAAQIYDRWIVPCAKDLLSTGAKSLILAGHRAPLEVHVLATAMSEVLGNVNHTVNFYKGEELATSPLPDLAKALNSGEIQTLVICGGNPAYNAPVDLNWDSSKAKTVIRLGYYEDENVWDTSRHAATHWDIPSAHYLESWGDCRSFDGTLLPVQPLIEPLFGGMTELELLVRIGGFPTTSAHQIVRETFQTFRTGDEEWGRFLYNGFLEGSATTPIQATFDWSKAANVLNKVEPAPAPTPQKLDVVFHRDYRMDDGRYNNNGWLQELPDPITKLTWDNAMLLSPKTAQELGVASTEISDSQAIKSNIVEITLNGRVLRGPVWVQPGMADNTIGLALGYGRTRTGRVGSNTGYNAYRVRTSTSPHYASGATLRRTGGFYPLATTQSHWSMENRAIVREATLEHYRQEPRFAKAMDRPQPPNATLYPNPLDSAKATALHQWGMAIDLNACTGCSACVIACQSENNVPIVGKQMVGKSREMHWLRIDRYYTGSIHAPRTLMQPMLCQHCEAAPCENVCPVNATVHNEEGLNLMVYNRCVGTRYCSNNCPYKVRRFNFFDYNRRPLDRLYESPLTSTTDGQWSPKHWFKNPDRGSLPEDEWQLSKLVKNPDVTVRMRGVMEKCTFCQQRIEQARIAQKVKAGASDAICLSERDGTIPQTACQQACPADAIVFGDVSDPQSRVSKLKNNPRNYQVLEFLGIKPRLSYLAKVRNLNPEMPEDEA